MKVMLLHIPFSVHVGVDPIQLVVEALSTATCLARVLGCTGSGTQPQG